jgi:hypothetical protein
MDCSDFAWTFPVYILASSYSRDRRTGEIIFDDKLRFLTPEAWPGGERCVAIFTDSDLAESFRFESSKRIYMDLVPFESPARLRQFLIVASEFYRVLVVDLNRKTRRAEPFAIEEVIHEMERLED